MSKRCGGEVGLPKLRWTWALMLVVVEVRPVGSWEETEVVDCSSCWGESKDSSLLLREKSGVGSQ